MVAKESVYKESKVITLKDKEEDPDKYGFTFGLKKAKLILEHIEDIKLFVGKGKE